MPNIDFPIVEISKLGEKESWRKEVNRPIYHIHKWWAQRLGSVFRAILLYLCKKNPWLEFYNVHDLKQYTVLDPFLGSGTTVGEALKLGMNAIGCDINPISSFLVKQELTRVDLEELKKEFDTLESSIAKDIKQYYKTINIDSGNEIPVLYYFWVKIAELPTGEEIPLFSKYVFASNAYPSKKPEAQIICPNCWNIFTGKYDDIHVICPHCGNEFNPQKGQAGRTTVFSKDGHEYKIKDLLPKNGLPFREKMYALLAIDEENNKRYQPIQNFDINLYTRAQAELRDNEHLFPLPFYEVESGYNTDQAIAYNYKNWKSFFNDRQLLCLSKLLSKILEIKNHDIMEQFLCLFSSTLEFNNTFCSYKGEGTGAVRPIFSNHILKPERTPLENSIWGYEKSSGCFSSLFKTKLLKAKEYLDAPFELNILEGTPNKIVASKPLNPHLCESWGDFKHSEHSALILNGDSSSLNLPDSSIDFVVTDPPYFDFIHYSELSDFFYAWLSPVLKKRYHYFEPRTSRRNNEVQQTDAAEFAKLLGNVFSECKRVLKPEGKLAFSFHHSRADGWVSIADAIKAAELHVIETFPVHAELMASTPKAGTKEPISLDAIIICGKKADIPPREAIISKIEKYKEELLSVGKKLSKSDCFVIAASQCLPLIVDTCNNHKSMESVISEIYHEIMGNTINENLS